jgi:hypothetical protein
MLSYVASCREALVEMARLPDVVGGFFLSTALSRGDCPGDAHLRPHAWGIDGRLGASKTTGAGQETVEAFRRAVADLRERYEQVRGTPRHMSHPLVAILAFNRFMGICTRLAETLGVEIAPAPKVGREALVDKTIRRQAIAGGIAMVVVPCLWSGSICRRSRRLPFPP